MHYERNDPWLIRHYYSGTLFHEIVISKEEKWKEFSTIFYSILDNFIIPINDLKKEFLINFYTTWNKLIDFEFRPFELLNDNFLINSRNLKNRIDILEKKIHDIYQKLKFFENNIKQQIEFKSISNKFNKNMEFINQEEWLLKQKNLYPNEIIAYTIRNKNLRLLAHSNDQKILLNKIDKLIEEKIISEKDKIYFR
ncbi:MAG: hypothetical protein ACTSQJ_08360 [Promethearchaeota archaeon]